MFVENIEAHAKKCLPANRHCLVDIIIELQVDILISLWICLISVNFVNNQMRVI